VLPSPLHAVRRRLGGDIINSSLFTAYSLVRSDNCNAIFASLSQSTQIVLHAQLREAFLTLFRVLLKGVCKKTTGTNEGLLVGGTSHNPNANPNHYPIPNLPASGAGGLFNTLVTKVCSDLLMTASTAPAGVSVAPAAVIMICYW